MELYPQGRSRVYFQPSLGHVFFLKSYKSRICPAITLASIAFSLFQDISFGRFSENRPLHFILEPDVQ